MSDPFELEKILGSFRVLADRREQNTSRAATRFAALDDPERVTLDYGDYCAQVTLADGKVLHDTAARIYPHCVIERKMSLDELAQNFTRHRDRFRAEFERARENNAKVYLLVEGASWEALDKHRYRSRYHPKAFKASLMAWMVRYGVTPLFCKPETSGEMIREVLYRDTKERLENGELG